LPASRARFAKKIKKAIRDDGGKMTEERRTLLAKELGDVLWYVSTMCSELGLNLDEVATGNLAKLAARQATGKLHGSGDLR
jgi:NTP pyrophosphatase (non-canonical NTP hydrolase)